MHHRSSGYNRFTPGVLAPVRVMLSRSIITLIDPMRPTRQRTAISPTRLIRDAFAVRPKSSGRLGDQRVVPCFHGLFSVGMSSPETPGSSSAAYTQFLHRRRWPSHTLGKSRHFPHPLPSDSRRGTQFRGFTAVHLRYNLPTCSPPLSELTRVTPSQPRLLLPRFQRIDRSHRWRI